MAQDVGDHDDSAAPAEDEGLVVYIKFQADVVTEFRGMSFKEKSDGS